MTGKFFEFNSDGTLGISLDPDNDDERLLLKIFEQQMQAAGSETMCWGGSHMSLSENEAGRGMPYLKRLKLVPKRGNDK